MKKNIGKKKIIKCPRQFTAAEIENAARSFQIYTWKLNKKKYKELFGRDLLDSECIFVGGKVICHPDEMDRVNNIFSIFKPSTTKFKTFEEMKSLQKESGIKPGLVVDFPARLKMLSKADKK